MPVAATPAAELRPPRAEIDPAALALIERYGPQILRTARRFSASLEDAEDAYQRALEILLTKAPTTNEAELVPWLKTVVKHEAFAVRRHRERTPLSDDGAVEHPGAALPTDEQVERYERLRLGAEAMRSLKPQEVRALLLKAEGYSYKQIQEITGWTYTKVNRCLAEGRASFLARVAGIEAGEECDRIAPLLSAMADGEASAEDMARIRPHVRGCLACRATLREFRATPSTLSGLMPPAVLAGGAEPSWIDWFHERAASLSVKVQGAAERVHQLLELGSAQKAAAVVAATAAVAGGGTAAVKTAEGSATPPRPARAAERAERPKSPAAPRPRPALPPPAATPSARRAPKPQPAPPPKPATSEFAPEPARQKPDPAPPAPAKPAEAQPAEAEFGP